MSYGAILNQTFPSAMLPQLIVSTLVPMSSVTATVNDVVYQGTLTNNKWYIDVEGLGACVINGTKADGSGTEQTSLNINYVGQYEVMLSNFDPVLNNNSWADIRSVADAGEGANYWAVGDAKQITLNGTVGSLSLSNFSTYAFIIGFNHNSGREGSGRIHFQLAKTALSGGTDICFTDGSYNSIGSSVAFRMNTSKTNSGGWEDSYMRNNICGISKESLSATIMEAIPTDLRNALKSVTKYTNNNGSSSSQSAVTATTDYFFLLSEYEVFGSITYSNTYEANYQQQYVYYSAGNSKVKYRHDNTGSAAQWWLRSPRAGTPYSFVFVYADGTAIYYNANYSLGFAPAFCV